MDKSPLGKLPRELRDRIYEYTFTLNEPIELCVNIEGPEHLDTGKASILPPQLKEIKNTLTAISATCKQARRETSTLAFKYNNELYVDGSEWDSWTEKKFELLERYLGKIADINTAEIKHISLEAGTLYFENYDVVGKLWSIWQFMRELKATFGKNSEVSVSCFVAFDFSDFEEFSGWAAPNIRLRTRLHYENVETVTAEMSAAVDALVGEWLESAEELEEEDEDEGREVFGVFEEKVVEAVRMATA